MKACPHCGREIDDEATSCYHCLGSFDGGREEFMHSRLVQWRKKRLLPAWLFASLVFGCLLFSLRDASWQQRLTLFFFMELFLGMLFLFYNWVQTRAMDASSRGEEFRTGRPPTWRIVIYALIATAIPIYFTYPDLGRLTMPVKLLLGLVLLLPGGMVVFMGIIMPAVRDKNKTWIAEHRGLLIKLLGFLVLLGVALQLWGMLHKK